MQFSTAHDLLSFFMQKRDSSYHKKAAQYHGSRKKMDQRRRLVKDIWLKYHLTEKE